MFQKIKDPKQIRNNRVAVASTVTIATSGMNPMPFPFNVSTLTSGITNTYAMCIDNSGKFIYTSSYATHCITKFDICANAVTVIAGSNNNPGTSDGAGTSAGFNQPFFICINPSNQYLYVCDYGNNKIRKVDVTTNIVSTFFSGISGPVSICINKTGTTLYVGSSDFLIYKISNITGTPTSTVIAGIINQSGYTNGSLGTSTLNTHQICVDSTESYLYFTQQIEHIIRRVQLSNNNVTTLAGIVSSSGNSDGANNAAKFNYPKGITVDFAGEYVYVADSANFIIRKINTTTGYTSTTAGIDGGNSDGTQAKFGKPVDITFDPTYQYLYVSDMINNAIRRFQISTAFNSIVTTSYNKLL